MFEFDTNRTNKDQIREYILNNSEVFTSGTLARNIFKCHQTEVKHVVDELFELGLVRFIGMAPQLPTGGKRARQYQTVSPHKEISFDKLTPIEANNFMDSFIYANPPIIRHDRYERSSVVTL